MLDLYKDLRNQILTFIYKYVKNIYYDADTDSIIKDDIEYQLPKLPLDINKRRTLRHILREKPALKMLLH